MITWMQTHKKWLIVTIWIATIAFIGAGFVGWGAYSYGKKQDEVARVKDTSIRVKDIQATYNQLFNQLNQMMGGKLDEATAKNLGLQQQAFQQTLTKAMLIQFAKDNGLYITDEELAKELLQIKVFHKNGKFDKGLYKQYLTNSRKTAEEFETELKNELLIFKISKALNLPTTKTLEDTLASFITMEDRVTIKIIQAPQIDVNDDEIKTYWQKNRDKYKSALTYDIGYFYVPLQANIQAQEISNYYDEHKMDYTNEDGKILSLDEAKDKVKHDLLAKKTKKEAILTMKKLKNGQMEFEKAQNITIQNNYISPENMQKLIQKKFLKPTLTEKGWLIATLIKINKPTPLPYDKAKNLAKDDLINIKTEQKLKQLAKDNLENFKGEDIGFIGRDDVMKLKNLSINEASSFIMKLFESNKPKGYVLLPQKNPQKVVLFNITEQKLLNKEKYNKYKSNIIKSAKDLKMDELDKNLIRELKRVYQSQIEVFMKI